MMWFLAKLALLFIGTICVGGGSLQLGETDKSKELTTSQAKRILWTLGLGVICLILATFL